MILQFKPMGGHKVWYEQSMEKVDERPTIIMWVDVKKADGRHQSRLVVKEFSCVEAMCAAPLLGSGCLPTSSKVRTTRTGNAMCRHTRRRQLSIRASFCQHRPDTYGEVLEAGRGWSVRGELEKVMHMNQTGGINIPARGHVITRVPP